MPILNATLQRIDRPLGRNVLVTGAAGFAGRHLCRYLSGLSYRITGTFHHSSIREKIPACNWVSLDLQKRAQVDNLIAELKPDFVYHLAAQSIPRLSWNLPEETTFVNTGGTIFLLNALRQHAPHSHLLLASTTHVYGKTFRQKSTVSESDLLWPETPYGGSKALAEYACRNFSARFGIHTAIARAFNHTGRGQGTDFVFSDWCRQIALAEANQKEPVLCVGNLKVERDFLHVDDVVRAYHLLAEKSPSGEIYNVGTGETLSLQRCLEYLLSKSRVRMQIKVEKAKVRSNEIKKMTGSIDKLKNLGWAPTRSVFEAIDELLDEWRKQI